MSHDIPYMDLSCLVKFWHVYLVGGIPTPLKNMSSSDGIIIPNIWKVIKNLPNHQPGTHHFLIPNLLLVNFCQPLPEPCEIRGRTTWSQFLHNLLVASQKKLGSWRNPGKGVWNYEALSFRKFYSWTTLNVELLVVFSKGNCLSEGKCVLKNDEHVGKRVAGNLIFFEWTQWCCFPFEVLYPHENAALVLVKMSPKMV